MQELRECQAGTTKNGLMGRGFSFAIDAHHIFSGQAWVKSVNTCGYGYGCKFLRQIQTSHLRSGPTDSVYYF